MPNIDSSVSPACSEGNGVDQQLAALCPPTVKTALALCESEQRFHLLADAAPTLIWMADDQGACTFLNKQWLAFTGGTLAEQIGEGWLAWIHPDDRDGCIAIFREAFARREPFNTGYRLRSHDDSFRWVLDHGVPRFDATGDFIGYIGCCTDATELRETERRLDEQIRFEQLLTDMAMALVNCPLGRLDGEIEQWLRRFADFLHMEVGFIAQLSENQEFLSSINVVDFGKTRRYTLAPVAKVSWLMEIIRQRDVAVITSRSANPTDISLEAYDQLWFFMRRGMESLLLPSGLQRFRRWNDGATHPLGANIPLSIRDPHKERRHNEMSLFRSLILIPLYVANVELGVLAAGSHSEHDWPKALTQRFRLIGVILSAALERKRKELALSQAEAEKAGHREMLAHIGRIHTLGEMATSIAHELNQPLAAIGNYVETALAWLTNGPVDKNQLSTILTKVSGQSLRAGKVLNKLRTLVKKSDAEIRVCNINDIIRDISTLAEVDARLFGCSIEMQLAQGLPSVSVDPVQIQQVVLNLIRNGLDAIKQYCDKQPHIRISTAEENGQVKVSVMDNGVGIGQAEREQIFQPFYSSRASGMGLGLGLTICQKIIEAHHGSIGFTDNPEGGMEFYFLLPSLQTV